ncbi:DUF5011 domain-containing protein [Mycoplasmatota bacterium WC44]
MYKNFLIIVLAIMLSSCENVVPSQDYHYLVGSSEPDWSFLGNVIFESVDMDILGEYYVIYEINDKQHQATVNIVDTIDPVIELIGDDVYLEVGSDYIEPGYTVTDNFDHDLFVEVSSDLDIDSIGDYTVSYSVTDSSRNSFSISRRVYVSEQTILTLNGLEVIDLELGEEYVELGCAVNKEVEVVIEGNVDVSVIGTYYIKYIVDSLEVVRTINVVDSETVVTLIGESVIQLELGSEYVELGASVNKEINIVIDGFVDVFTEGTYYIKYIVDGLEVVRTVNVVDNVETKVTLIGDSVIELEVKSEYVELGAYVNKDKEVIIEGTVDINEIGIYYIKYSVDDIEVVRTVNVVDTIEPVLILIGTNVTLRLGESYQELGVTVSDNYDTELEVIISSNIDINNIGEYLVTYSVIDFSGNYVEVIRTVNVVDDTKPEIELIGKDLIYLDHDAEYYEDGVIASDNYSSVEVIILGEVKTGVSGVYHLIYKAIDSSGNESLVVRTVVVNERVELLYNVGDRVYFNGTYYSDSEGNGASGSIKGEYVIDKIIDAPYPYLITPVGGVSPYGWTDVMSLSEIDKVILIDELVINQNLLDISNKKVGDLMSPTYIVIHNTANIASAYNEIAYLHNPDNTTYTSFHFAVDESEIWQGVETKYNAWHAGDGAGSDSYNRNSIGIEIARSLHEDELLRERATNLAAMLTAKLMMDFNISIENVVTHHDASGKYCPHDIFDGMGWDNFIKLVESFLE